MSILYSIVFFYSTSWKNIHQDNVDDNSIIKKIKKRIIRNEKIGIKKSIKNNKQNKKQWKMRKQIKIKKNEINYKRNWKQKKRLQNKELRRKEKNGIFF